MENGSGRSSLFGAIGAPFEVIGDLTLKAFDALYPVRTDPPPPPDPPPPEQPVVKPITGFILGVVPETSDPICATDDELDRHMLLLGATGTGKTTLICRLFDEEVQRWR